MVSTGIVNERTYRGACVIELIHTATLVHDDVVDDSNRRRSFSRLMHFENNKIAVLVGDYLFSKVYYFLLIMATLICSNYFCRCTRNE
jgi:octaprenyl-diphosphate synthase